jgi:hypothetical protein
LFEAQGPFPEAGWDGVWAGKDPEYGMSFEVLAGLWSKSGAPTQDYLKKAHKKRLGSRAIPLAVFTYDKSGNAWLFGPSTNAGVIELTKSQGQRLLQSALNEPDASSARTLLLQGRDALAEHGDAGVLLQGLFSDQQILRGLPKESGWQAACERGAKVLGGNHRDIDLVRALGYQHKEIAGDALLLSLGGEPPRAVAILLRSSEAFDAAGARFSKSPIYHGLEIARRNNVPWLVVARGSEIRLYPTSPSVGVGRRGATQTYFGLDLALIDETKAGYLDLAFSAKALAPNGSVDQILNDSKTYVAALSSRLRDRVYEDVVSRLSVAVAEKLRESGPLDADRLALAYRLTLKILFRLLFQAYAEDIRVLPFQRNERYTAASLKQLARHMAEEPHQADSPESTSLFDGLLQVWRVIDHGDPDWGVPAYNGGLFGTDAVLYPDGAAIEKLALTNDVLGPALRGLLVDVAQDGTLGPVDFRSLDVRDFGTIYEGLLEAGLSIAEDNLADDGKGGWKIAQTSDEILVQKAHPYFHTKSGERKATGSYFTPTFVVEHLLERSLAPALDEHLARVTELLTKQNDQVGAARAFFDFRVADLAMGSGHFLVAAISHIEQKFGSFLEQHPIPGVERELIELKDAAAAALKEVGVIAEIDRSSLLSRQIAKRCIYGIDINEIAVELARLAIWVRTFVPGLPMSSLNHQLVCGNSLSGVGTVEESILALAPESAGQTISFSEEIIQAALRQAKTILEDAAMLKEASHSEVRASLEASKAAIQVAQPVRKLMDLVLAIRIGDAAVPVGFGDQALNVHLSPKADERVRLLAPVHFPIQFPEVFLRENPGFDVVVGNPPWEKLHVKEDAWWTLRFPGLLSLSPREKLKRIESLHLEYPELSRAIANERTKDELLKEVIAHGPYPGVGSAHIDLYVVFAWRNWTLTRTNGKNGLVLPRSAFVGSGTQEWRREVLRNGAFSSIIFAVNAKEWVFEGVASGIAVAFVVITKTQSSEIRAIGPVFSLPELLAKENSLGTIPASTIAESNSAAIPSLKNAEDAAIFSVMAKFPPLSSKEQFDVRLVQGDINSTSQRTLFQPEPDEQHKIPVLSGGSINIWSPSYAAPFGWGGKELQSFLLERAQRSKNRKGSPYQQSATDRIEQLQYQKPRIAIRQIARGIDTRTCIVSMIPPGSVTVHGLHYLHRVSGTVADEAYLLGIFSSIPFDWYLRAWVELNLTFEILYPCPIPRFETAGALETRLIENSATLVARDTRFAGWAREVGVNRRDLDQAETLELASENDALVAHLYKLSRQQVGQIFGGFHRGWDSSKQDYVDRFERVMKHFDAWAARA